MKELFNSESTHWYDKNGLPVYTLPQKKDPSKTKSPDIRDAESLELYPSVTTIMRVLHKPGLQQWLYQQYILSALTLPQLPNESLDDFATRVVKDARAESNRAADFGSRLHSLIEWWLRVRYLGEAPEPPDDLTYMDTQFLKGVTDWLNNHEIEPVLVEHSFTNAKLGYGGRLDFKGKIDGQMYIVDWKTQNTTGSDGKPREVNWYSEWPPQLRAYSKGIGEPDDTPLLSVVASSTEPGRVETMVHYYEDWQWETFLAMHRIWYSPLGPGERLRSRFPNSIPEISI